MTVITHSVNGVELDGEWASVQQGSTFLAAVETSRQALTASMRQGTIRSPYRPQFSERTVDITLNAYGERFARETARIVRLATLPQVTLGRVVDGVRQEAQVELVSVSEGDSDLPHVEPLTLRFALPGVWWRGLEAVTMQLALTGGMFYPPVGPVDNEAGYYTMALGVPDDSPSLLYTDLPDYYLSSAPIPDAILRFPANVTAVSVTDPLTGTGVTWSGSAGSQYLYLDAGTLTAWRSANTAAWTGGTNVKGVDYPAAGPLQVNPQADGSYTVDASVTGGDGNGNILIHFKQSWW